MAPRRDSLQSQIDDLRKLVTAQDRELAGLRSSRTRRRRGFAAHLVTYIALLLLGTAAGAGALSGTNTVLSDDIVDGEVKTADIAANGVLGSKVKDGSLTGADLAADTLTGTRVNEDSLNLGSFFASKSAYNFYCSPAAGSATDCVSVSITLARPTNVLIVGSGYVFEHADGFAAMYLRVDGVNLQGRSEFTEPERENWAQTRIVALAAGTHTVSLSFSLSSGNLDAYENALSVAQVNS